MAHTQPAGTMTRPGAGTPAGPGYAGPGLPVPPGLPAPSAGPQPEPGLMARTRARRDAWTTPTRLWLALLGTVLSILLLAGVAAAAVQSESTAARQTNGAVEFRAVNVQELYYALSDADAAAATGILDSPAPSARFTTRYQSDITQADDALAESSVDVVGDQAASAQLQRIDEQLSEYTGLIGTAQADNRLGYPVGGAYLREASNLLEQNMLPEVQSVLAGEISARSGSAGAAGGLPLWTLPAGLLVLVAGFRTWRLLASRTRRSVNAGLAAGLALSALLFGWVAVASITAADHMSVASADFRQVAAAQQGRGDAAQISADEASSVVSEGADNGAAAALGQSAVTDLNKELFPATFGDATADNSDIALWGKVNSDVTAIQNDAKAGDYGDATTAMVGSSPTTAGGAQVDLDAMANALAGTEQSAQTAYERESSKAVGDYPGGPWPILLLGLLAAGAAGYGITRRIAEYR